MRKGFAFLTLMVAAAGGAAVAAPPPGCPTEDEVRAAVERYIQEDWWSPSQRETWQIADVSSFSFGPVKYGKPNYGQCPLRVEYAFKVTHKDGRIEETRKGTGETFSFSRNDFDEWTFAVGPS